MTPRPYPGYDLTPTMLSHDPAAWADYATVLDGRHPDWYADDLDRMSPGLREHAQARRDAATRPTPALCRSDYYTDTGRQRRHGDRSVNCGLPANHGGDLHDEMVDGEPGVVTWPVRPVESAAVDEAAKRDRLRTELEQTRAERDKWKRKAKHRKTRAEYLEDKLTEAERANQILRETVDSRVGAADLHRALERVRIARAENDHLMRRHEDLSNERNRMAPVVAAARAWRSTVAGMANWRCRIPEEATLIASVDGLDALRNPDDPLPDWEETLLRQQVEGEAQRRADETTAGAAESYLAEVIRAARNVTECYLNGTPGQVMESAQGLTSWMVAYDEAEEARRRVAEDEPAESDEPVDAVKAAFDRGEKGVTAPDLARHLRSAGWSGQFTPGVDQ